MVGVKKINDEASAQQLSVRSLVVPNQLVTGLLIGAIAGIVGVIANGYQTSELAPKDIVALLFIGYAGADFIEGFIRREQPRSSITMGAVPGAAPGAAQPTLGTGPQIRNDQASAPIGQGDEAVG